jgi:hypothetical protein
MRCAPKTQTVTGNFECITVPAIIEGLTTAVEAFVSVRPTL